MPNEPQKKAEELLRAYARKRQEDAGAPLDLHPANRRLLQDEVTRIYRARRTRAISLLSSFLTFWPRLTLAAAVFVALGLVAWMLTRSGEVPPETFSLAKRQEQDVKLSEAHFKEKLVDDSATSASASVSSNSKSELRDGLVRPRISEDRSVKLAEETLKPEATSELELGRGVTTPVAEARKRPVAANEPTAPNDFAATSNQNRSYAFNLGDASTTDASALPRFDPALGQQPLLSYAVSPFTNALGLGAETELNRRNLSRPESENLLPGPLAAATDTKRPARRAPAAEEALSLAQQPEAGARQLAKPLPAAAGATNILAQQRSRFRRLELSEPAKAAARNQTSVAANQAGLQSVLNSFELVQTEGRIEIRDADGSIYNGIVVSSPLANTRDQIQLRLAKETPPPDESVPRQTDRFAQQSTQNAASMKMRDSTQDAVAFRVLGTNHSLNQMVILEGELWTRESALAPRESALAAGKDVNSAQPPIAQPSQNTRLNTLNTSPIQAGSQNRLIQVQGNLRVGTVETQLRAVQVPAE